MKEVAANVYRLGTKGHNFYVVRDGDAVTIIDAGCSREWRKLAKGLTSLGLTLDAVSGIVATHAHSDHFGFAQRAIQHGINVGVHIDEETRALGTYQGRYAASAKEIPTFNLSALRTFVPMILAGVLKLDFVTEVQTFRDGERLDLPGHPVVLHTPGHTEGHSMFHLPDHGLLFTGDGLVTMDMLGDTRGPQMMDQRFHLDPILALASLFRMNEIDADVLLPGHGPPWHTSPDAAVEAAYARLPG